MKILTLDLGHEMFANCYMLIDEKYEINILQKATEYVDALKESKDPEYLTYKTYLAYLNNYIQILQMQ